MKKFAVAFINFFDNELHLEIIEAQDWQSAAKSHTKTMFTPDVEIPSTIEDAERLAFEFDGAFAIQEIS